MKVIFAPIQGFTDDVYRQAHRQVYGNAVDEYYTPFVRREHGEIRPKDRRDALSAIAEDVTTVQIIVKNVEEFNLLVQPLIDAGCRRIDINAGCPYPMQTSKGRGSGLLAHCDDFEAIMAKVNQLPDVDFSLKMRLGMVEPTEWHALIPVINETKLSYVTVHPRVAKQLYKGELWQDEFARACRSITCPLVYNGDLRTVDDIRAVMELYPQLHGVMMGRGLLSRPSLANELKNNETWTTERCLQAVLKLHDVLLERYSSRLQGGDHQLLMKMKTTWEYLEDFIGHKQWKAIHKSTSMAKYEAAVNSLRIL